MVSRPNVCGSSSRSMESGMPDYGFGRCDGHHKMIDFRLEKKRRPALVSPAAVHQLYAIRALPSGIRSSFWPST
jgi:hypothetical protein